MVDVPLSRFVVAGDRTTLAGLLAAATADAGATLRASLRIRLLRGGDADLARRASTDPLTGVDNRPVFLDRLQQALRRLERHPGLVAVMYLDLDGFKRVNDRLGHHAGDAVLHRTADRLRAALRPGDTLARLGGDEFALLVEDMDSMAEVVAIAERIVARARDVIQVGTDDVVCTASIGIGHSTDPHMAVQELMQQADVALYRAKDTGRDRVQVFDEVQRGAAAARRAHEQMLRLGMQGGHLRLAYQPVEDLRSGRTVGAEALVRLHDPTRPTLVPAASFLGLAGDAGLLGTMDRWVIAGVLAQAAAWGGVMGARGFSHIDVNVTARHLSEHSFTRTVLGALDHHGLSASVLQVEVREPLDLQAAAPTLDRLRGEGVRIGLDDFGSDESSLAALRQLPLDLVKIDGALVSQLGAGRAVTVWVRSIVELCHALGVMVCAKGVETPEKHAVVTDLGCDQTQGFHYSPPLSAEAMEQTAVDQAAVYGAMPSGAASRAARGSATA